MKSFEALKKCIGPFTEMVAKALYLSWGLIYKWQEPTGGLFSGKRNPLDTLETTIQTTLDLRHPRDEALAPVYWLNARFGLVSFTLPKGKEPAEVSKALLLTVKEFGDVARVAAKALEDDDIDRPEADRINKEVLELIRQAAAFNHIVQEAASV